MARSLTEVCREVDLFFMGESRVHNAARQLSRGLQELKIPFGIAGALAANAHGHQRTTGGYVLRMTL